MPRTPRTTSSAVPSAAKVRAAIAKFPFAPDRDASKAPAYEALPAPMQAAIAEQIAKDRAAGLSGDQLREHYSGPGTPTNRGLTGQLRRKVLRAHGFGSVVARSYDAYSDGDARKGTAHARQHGAQAAERQAAELAAIEEQAAKTRKRAAKPATTRKRAAAKPAAASKRTPRKRAA